VHGQFKKLRRQEELLIQLASGNLLHFRAADNQDDVAANGELSVTQYTPGLPLQLTAEVRLSVLEHLCRSPISDNELNLLKRVLDLPDVQRRFAKLAVDNGRKTIGVPAPDQSISEHSEQLEAHTFTLSSMDVPLSNNHRSDSEGGSLLDSGLFPSISSNLSAAEGAGISGINFLQSPSQLNCDKESGKVIHIFAKS
jgi:hypothetical protein